MIGFIRSPWYRRLRLNLSWALWLLLFAAFWFGPVKSPTSDPTRPAIERGFSLETTNAF
jgi:hypothetical protein